MCCPHRAVKPAIFKQLFMGALFSDIAVLYNIKPVSILYGGEPVSNNYKCLALHELCHAALYDGFVFGVGIGCGFIKDYDPTTVS